MPFEERRFRSGGGLCARRRPRSPRSVGDRLCATLIEGHHRVRSREAKASERRRTREPFRDRPFGSFAQPQLSRDQTCSQPRARVQSTSRPCRRPEGRSTIEPSSACRQLRLPVTPCSRSRTRRQPGSSQTGSKLQLQNSSSHFVAGGPRSLRVGPVTTDLIIERRGLKFNSRLASALLENFTPM